MAKIVRHARLPPMFDRGSWSVAIRRLLER
jgi:hypothetical protein